MSDLSTTIRTMSGSSDTIKVDAHVSAPDNVAHIYFAIGGERVRILFCDFVKLIHDSRVWLADRLGGLETDGSTTVTVTHSPYSSDYDRPPAQRP